MARQICRTCAKDFYHDKVGRPPVQCPDCRQAYGIEGQQQQDSSTDKLAELKRKLLEQQQNGGQQQSDQDGTEGQQDGSEDSDSSDEQQDSDKQDDKQDTEQQQDATESLLERAVMEVARKVVPDQIDSEQVRAIIREEIASNPDNAVTRIVLNIRDIDHELPDSHHFLLPKVSTVLLAGCHLFLVGPAGSGKSTLAHQAADSLGLSFQALSLGPTTPTSKLFGYMNATGEYVSTPFRLAYESGGVMLLDELDNGHPGLVAEINQALANGYCAFADGMVKRHDDFRMVATGNTFGKGPDRMFVGRNILDAATLDRFVTLEVPIDEKLERNLALPYATEDKHGKQVPAWIDYVQTVRKAVTERKLPVVVSPRSTIEGAKLLQAGIPLNEVKDMRLFAGISEEVRSQIDGRNGAKVPADRARKAI